MSLLYTASAAPSRVHALPASSAEKRFVRIEKIGEGSYGVVFKCIDTRTNQVVAIKRVPLDSHDSGIPLTSLREISLLKYVKHPNVVHLLNVVFEKDILQLVFEYLHQDLRRLIDSRCTPMIGPTIKRVVFQLLAGLHACHSSRVVHRDLKPQNILVSADQATVKIADFGLARAFRVPVQTYTHEVVTLWYRAPELLLGERHYTPAVDIWSLGCIMAELATRKPLFIADCEIQQLYTIFTIRGTPGESSWPGVSQLPNYSPHFPRWKPSSLASHVPTLCPLGVSLLEAMLTCNPEARIPAYAALQHPWFDEVREDLWHLV